MQDMWLSSRQKLVKVAIPKLTILSNAIKVSMTVHYLGDVMDSQMTSSSHVGATCQMAYYKV